VKHLEVLTIGSAMERSSVASSGIVREVLTRDNYEEWKTLMRNYLIGKNLWDVVVGSGSASTEVEARRMNGEALHLIQLSCGPHSFDQIKHFETAQGAWNHLAALYGSEFKAQPHVRHGTYYVFRCILKCFFICIYLHITLFQIFIYVCM